MCSPTGLHIFVCQNFQLKFMQNSTEIPTRIVDTHKN